MPDRDDDTEANSSSENRFGGPAARPGVSFDETKIIGQVVSVEGSRAAARLVGSEALLAAGLKSLQIGSLVKMHLDETTVFAMVKGLNIPELAAAQSDAEIRIMELELVGEGVPGPGGGAEVFRRGVSFYPTLGDSVYAVNQDDLTRVYAQPNVSAVKVGTIYQDRNLPAYVSVDDLLGKHFAVLGTTGSGKSCAVSTMLRAILSQHREGHVLLLDLHGEYGHAFTDFAELLGAGEFSIPYWLLNFEEFQEIVVEKTDDLEIDRSILREAVIHARKLFDESAEKTAAIDGDSPVPYRLQEVLRYLDSAVGKLDKPTGAAPYIRLRNRINALLADRRFAFMFQEGFNVADDMAEILARLFRVPANGKPITILDLSEVPSDIMKVVISLLCRMTFDFAYWSEGDTPVLLVCEEAHRYAGQLDGSGFDLTKRALSRIVNEGRKYGVSLGIVSQRPSELDLGILSQCSTIFAMRMNNLKDQEYVRGTLSESGLGLIDALPSLRTGEAIVVGEGVSVPARVYLNLLPENQRPRSSTAEFSKYWKEGAAKEGEGEEGAVANVVNRWRR
ncbi:MAG: ATP-binding protein, partial [Alphaproteobacteria bacterium]|nr:ATP-binding protein [Alphaproteobacteria bacterium]